MRRRSRTRKGGEGRPEEKVMIVEDKPKSEKKGLVDPE